MPDVLPSFTKGYMVQYACRSAINSQVVAFKRDFFFDSAGPFLCPILDIPMGVEDSDVHHLPPNDFHVLVHRWLEARGRTYEDIELNEPVRIRTARFADPMERADWADFHQANAKLVVISRTAHRLLGRSAA